MSLEESLIMAAFNWIRDTDYKLPPASGPEIKEIHVPAILIPRSGSVDTLVFNAETKKLTAIIFDVYDQRSDQVLIKRLDLP